MAPPKKNAPKNNSNKGNTSEIPEIPESIKKMGELTSAGMKFSDTSILKGDDNSQEHDGNTVKASVETGGTSNVNKNEDHSDTDEDEDPDQSDDTDNSGSDEDEDITPKSKISKGTPTGDVLSSLKTRKRRREKALQSGKTLWGEKNKKKKKISKTRKLMKHDESSKNAQKTRDDIIRGLGEMTEEERLKFGMESIIQKFTPEEREMIENRASWNQRLRSEAAKRGMKLEDSELDQMISYCMERNPEVSYAFAFLEGLRSALAQDSAKLIEDLHKIVSTGFSQIKQNQDCIESLKQTYDALNTVSTSLSIKTLDGKGSKKVSQPKEVAIGKKKSYKRPLSTAEILALAGKEDSETESDESDDSDMKGKKKRKLMKKEKKSSKGEKAESSKRKKSKGKAIVIDSDSDDDESDSDDSDATSESDNSSDEDEIQKEFKNWAIHDFLEILDADRYELSCASGVDELELEDNFLQKIFESIDEADWRKAARSDSALRKLKQQISIQLKLAFKLKKKEGKSKDKGTKKEKKPKN